MSASRATDSFRAARDLLQSRRPDDERAVPELRWPELDQVNFGFDWFDVVAAEQPETLALWIVHPDGTEDLLTYADLSSRSTQLASWLRAQGVDRGDRLLVLLGDVAPLWEVLLACIKLGVVVIPATTLLGARDLADHVDRGDVKHVVTTSEDTERFAEVDGDWTRIAVGEPVPGWLRYDDSYEHLDAFEAEVPTRSDETLLLSLTDGTGSRPEPVAVTHTSYLVGQMETAYLIGLQPGDLHLDVSPRDGAEHAWGDAVAPWFAGATAFVVEKPDLDAAGLLDTMARCGVTTFRAPPELWRMLVRADLAAHPVPTLREVVAAGEPLDPDVVEQVQRAWGLTVRDGRSRTEPSAQVGTPPTPA